MLLGLPANFADVKDLESVDPSSCWFSFRSPLANERSVPVLQALPTSAVNQLYSALETQRLTVARKMPWTIWSFWSLEAALSFSSGVIAFGWSFCRRLQGRLCCYCSQRPNVNQCPPQMSLSLPTVPSSCSQSSCL